MAKSNARAAAVAILRVKGLEALATVAHFFTEEEVQRLEDLNRLGAAAYEEYVQALDVHGFNAPHVLERKEQVEAGYDRLLTMLLDMMEGT